LKIAILEEYTRIGGGQNVVSDISKIYYKRGNHVDLFTDSTHLYVNGKYENIIPCNFSFNEHMNSIIILLKALKLKKELSKINCYDIIINNHPNIFLFKGDLNMMHTLSLIESALDDRGMVKKHMLLELVKIAGTYKMYNDSDFWAPGNFNKVVSERVFNILGIKSVRFHIIPLSVRFPKMINLKDKKKDQVLIFGRINDEKKLEIAIEIAKQSKLKFIIAGAVNPGNENYYRFLVSNAPSNLKIIRNPDEIMKDTLFRESGIFLHLRRRENFPISVLEGIAYGCIPVVPKYGGTWEDIALNGKFGLGYDSKAEGVEKLMQASTVSNEYRQLILESRERFSENLFTKRFLSLMDMLKTYK
jgi:glycosyltransferase involved in cell wall biosynthesis